MVNFSFKYEGKTRGEGQEEHTWIRFFFTSTSRPSVSQFCRPYLSRNNVSYEAYMGVPSHHCQMRRWWQWRREGEREASERASEWASNHMVAPTMGLPPGLACQCFMKCCAVPVHDPWPSMTLTGSKTSLSLSNNWEVPKKITRTFCSELLFAIWIR